MSSIASNNASVESDEGWLHEAPNERKNPHTGLQKTQRIQVNNKLKIDRNQEVKKGFYCSKCERGFVKQGNFRNHVCKQKKSNDRPMCPICGKRYANKYVLLEHLFVLHSNNGSFTCFLCKENFSSYDNLQWHFKKHMPHELLKCMKCSKFFPDLGSLEAHRCCNLGGNPLSCAVCSTTFKEVNTFVMDHPCIVTGNIFTCPCCQFNTNKPTTLVRHLGGHVDKGQYYCEICGLSYQTKTGFKVHSLKHSKKERILCKLCGKTFLTDSEVVRHGLRVHAPKKFKCDECPNIFTTQQALKYHVAGHMFHRSKANIMPLKVPNTVAKVMKSSISTPTSFSVEGKVLCQNKDLVNHAVNVQKDKKQNEFITSFAVSDNDYTNANFISRTLSEMKSEERSPEASVRKDKEYDDLQFTCKKPCSWEGNSTSVGFKSQIHDDTFPAANCKGQNYSLDSTVTEKCNTDKSGNTMDTIKEKDNNDDGSVKKEADFVKSNCFEAVSLIQHTTLLCTKKNQSGKSSGNMSKVFAEPLNTHGVGNSITTQEVLKTSTGRSVYFNDKNVNYYHPQIFIADIGKLKALCKQPIGSTFFVGEKRKLKTEIVLLERDLAQRVKHFPVKRKNLSSERVSKGSFLNTKPDFATSKSRVEEKVTVSLDDLPQGGNITKESSNISPKKRGIFSCSPIFAHYSKMKKIMKKNDHIKEIDTSDKSAEVLKSNLEVTGCSTHCDRIDPPANVDSFRLTQRPNYSVMLDHEYSAVFKTGEKLNNDWKNMSTNINTVVSENNTDMETTKCKSIVKSQPIDKMSNEEEHNNRGGTLKYFRERKCNHCSKTFSTVLSLLLHEKYEHLIQCTICKRSGFSTVEKLKDHLSHHLVHAVFTCQYCGDKLESMEKLQEHKKIIHNIGNMDNMESANGNFNISELYAEGTSLTMLTDHCSEPKYYDNNISGNVSVQYCGDKDWTLYLKEQKHLFSNSTFSLIDANKSTENRMESLSLVEMRGNVSEPLDDGGSSNKLVYGLGSHFEIQGKDITVGTKLPNEADFYTDGFENSTEVNTSVSKV